MTRGHTDGDDRASVVGVLQPMYLPWIGYFEQIALVDRFVLLDNVQYTKQDWRNRNRVKTPSGWVWLTVPVSRAHLKTTIAEMEVCRVHRWARQHLRTIRESYARAPYLHPLVDDLEAILTAGHRRLVDLNHDLIKLLCSYLNISTQISFASDIPTSFPSDPNDRLLAICRHFGVRVFYEGGSGARYLDTRRFALQGIEVVFQDYKHPVYAQLHGEFMSHLSVIDLVFNVGPMAPEVLRTSPVPSAITRTRGWECHPVRREST